VTGIRISDLKISAIVIIGGNMYKVLEAVSTSGLAYKVEELLRKGWVCQGGVTISNGKYMVEYFQAMVKLNVSK
jgi:hypothetical protein